MLELKNVLVTDWLSELFLWQDPSVHRLVASPLCDTVVPIGPVCLLNHQKWKKCSVSTKVKVWCWSWMWCLSVYLFLQVFEILICKRQHEVNSTVFTLNLAQKKKKVCKKVFVFSEVCVDLVRKTKNQTFVCVDIVRKKNYSGLKLKLGLCK